MIHQISYLLRKHFYSILLLTSIFCALILLYIKYYTAISAIPDVSGSERSTTIPVALVTAGISLFTDPEESPFFITQYAPLYLNIIGLSCKWLGFDPTDAYKIQLASRVGSAIFIFGALILNLVTAIRVLRITWQEAAIAIIFLFGLLQHWHLTNSRVDSLLFLLTSAYLYFILVGIRTNTAWNKFYFLAALMAILALFTKQSALIHCGILGLYFLLNKNWKALGYTLGTYIVTSLLLISLFSHFQFVAFFTHFFGSLNSPTLFDWFYDYTFTKLIPFALPLIIPAFVIALKWSVTSLNTITFFFSLSMTSFFFFAFGTSFKYGAGVGYFHEFCLVAILAVLYYFRNERFSQGSITKWVLPLLLVAYTGNFTITQMMKYKSTNFYEYSVEYEHQKKVNEFMRTQLLTQDKVVVIPGDNQAGNLLEQMLLKHIVAYQDDVIHFNNKNKSFDYSKLYEMAQNDGFKYIITKKPENDFYLNAISYSFDKSRYVLINEIEGYYIFQTKESTQS